MTRPRPFPAAVWSAACAVAVLLAGCAVERPSVPAETSSSSSPRSAGTTSPRSSSTALLTAPNAVPSGRTGFPRGGEVRGVKDDDPESVAAAVAQTTFRYDTAFDASPQDAARRAARWMTPEAAARVSALTAGGGAWWLTLSANHGWTSTTVRPDTEPPPPVSNASTARRVFVTVTAHAANGATLPGQAWVVVVALSQAPDGRWRASQVLSQPEGAVQP